MTRPTSHPAPRNPFDVTLADWSAWARREAAERTRDMLYAAGAAVLVDRPRGVRVAFEHAGETVTAAYVRPCEWTIRGRVCRRGIIVRSLDGQESAYASDEMTGLRLAGEPTLPECAAFVGTAGRCTRCRIRRGMHA